MKLIRNSVASAGSASGATMRTMTTSGPAPSMRAASSISSGI
jgi:hypothetical protein